MSRYGKFRSSRFLIDKIDAKLGDVNKEIEFDKNVIYICIGVIALEIVVLALTAISDFFAIPSIVGAFLTVFCLFVLVIMAQELQDDKRKSEKMKEKEKETESICTKR